MSAPIDALPALTSLGKLLDMSPNAFGLMRRSGDIFFDTDALRARFQEDGYLYLPGCLHRDQVLEARRSMLSRIDIQSLDPRFPCMDGVVKQGVDLGFRENLTRDNSALHRVLYGGPMMEFFARFLGGTVRHFDYTWVRCLAPGWGTPPHYDIVYMGRGTRKLYTAWVPMGDIDFELGGLMVLEGSHRNHRLLNGYAQRDVDEYCINKPERGIEVQNYGWLAQDPPRVRRGLGGRWLSHEFGAGDVVVFSTVLVHGGLDNRSRRIRLSTDSRYQLASEPVDHRWVGPDPPGHGPRGKRGKIC